MASRVLGAHAKEAGPDMCPPGRLSLTLVSGLLLRAPVAIGVAAMSTAEMLTSGLKGRGFSVLHTYQDHLWWVQCFFCFTGSWGVGWREPGFRSESFGPCCAIQQIADLRGTDFLAKCGEKFCGYFVSFYLFRQRNCRELLIVF